jgi:hypothetical protein
MGVMLSLDRHGPARGRRRQGQHARHPGTAALAAIRRYETPASSRLLSRLTRTVLARRSAVAGESVRARRTAGPARGRDDLTYGAPGEGAWSRYPGMSVACLLGECRDESGHPACDGGRCEHDCHRGASAPGESPGTGTASAA